MSSRTTETTFVDFFQGHPNSEGNTINDLMQLIETPDCTYTSDNTYNFMNWLFPSFIKSQRVSSVPTLTQSEAVALQNNPQTMHKFNANVDTMMNNWGFIRNTDSVYREYSPRDTYAIRYDGHTTQILLRDTDRVARFVNTGIKCMEDGPNQIRMSRMLQSMVALGRSHTAKSIVNELTQNQNILRIEPYPRTLWEKIVA